MNHRRNINPAFEAIHRRHRAFVDGLMHFWRVPASDRGDVAHNVWVTIFAFYEEGKIEKEKAWIARIVVNAVLKYRKRRTLVQSIMSSEPIDDADVAEPTGYPRDTPDLWLVRAALDQMSPEDEDILIQVAVFEIDIQDYAREAGIHRHTVAKRFHDAEKRFRAIVEGIREREKLTRSVVLGPALLAQIPPSERMSNQEHEDILRRAADVADLIRSAPRPSLRLGRMFRDRLLRRLARGIGSAFVFGIGVIVGRLWPPPSQPPPAIAGLRAQIITTVHALPAPPPVPFTEANEAPETPPTPRAAAQLAALPSPSGSTGNRASAPVRDEMTLLRGADLAREGGRCDDAERLLDAHAAQFPQGSFAELREALRARIREARRAKPPRCKVTP